MTAPEETVSSLMAANALLVQTIQELRTEITRINTDLMSCHVRISLMESEADYPTSHNGERQDLDLGDPALIAGSTRATAARKRTSFPSGPGVDPGRPTTEPKKSRKIPGAPTPTQAPPGDADNATTTPRSPEMDVDECGLPPSSSQAPSTAQQPPAAPKIPPVIMRDAAKWSEVSHRMDNGKINFSKAKQCPDGIRIQPVAEDDFRALTKLLDTLKYEYHTFALPSERTVKAVIRGIPAVIDPDDVLRSLQEANFQPTKVTRMSSRRTKRPFPLFLVELPQGQNIFTLTRLMSLVIRVEPPRPSKLVSQCHRCQRFHHAQRNCHAQARCVKCGQPHESSSCDKPKELPAKCANCSGEHTANYRGCPSFPGSKATKPAPKSPRAKPVAAQTAPPSTARSRSYASAAKTQTPQVSSVPAGSKDNVIVKLIGEVSTAKNGKDAVAKLLALLPQLLATLSQ